VFFSDLSAFDLVAGDIAEFRRAMDECAVAVIRRTPPLRDEEHLAFSRRLGPLQQMKMLQMVGKSTTRLSSLELIDVGNLAADGSILPDDDRRRAYNRGNLLWHTDVSFDAIRATYSLLAAHVVPPGGAPTEFADLRAAYDALATPLKSKIENLVAEHSIWHSRELAGLKVTDGERASRPPARHALVQRHPGSGRKTLYLASHASHIAGMPIEEGCALLRELMEFATQPQFVHRHAWRVGDLVIWDNLCTMHRGTPFDDAVHKRDMRRTTILEAAA
jgi:alpha-ketoglutarate-dependent 2,4-dichlorophenoxyacetate dioxygenase